MNFLPLLDERVVLSDALERQIIHQIYLVRIGDELVFKRLDCHGKSCRKQAYLPSWCCQVNELLQEWLELGREKFVGLRTKRK
jgi:hypothetical protein